MYNYLLILLFVLSSITCLSQRKGQIVEKSSDSSRNVYGLVVGISSYAHIRRLLYADDDAYLFADYLVNSNMVGKKNVVRLIDSSATQANFYKELKKLLIKVKPSDVVFIYFAGHGDVETDIESGFLLTYNCESTNYPASDAIDISMLERFVNAFVNKKVKVVLIVDACRSGNLAGGLIGAANTMTTLSKSFQNVIKILSCQVNQLSLEKYYVGGGHGVFTYHLVDGLSGFADKTGKHYITLKDIDRYLDTVGEETHQRQNAKVDGDPHTIIAEYSDTLKMIAINRKGVKADLAFNINRGFTDSTWENNSYYIKFNENVGKFRLTEPVTDNAYKTLQDAIKNKQPAALVEDMKLDLEAVLEDEAQKWINKYLRGELLENSDEKIEEEVLKMKTITQVLEDMIDTTDMRYLQIHVKKLFFEAEYGYSIGTAESFLVAITKLENADKLLPNQAWILEHLGENYLEIKQFEKAEAVTRKAMALSPNWPDPWDNLGNIYFEQRRYIEAENAYSKVIQLGLIDVGYYELACLFSVQNKKEKAFEYLELALKNGFSDFKLINKDSDMDNIRKTPRFIKLITMYKKDN